MKKYILLFVFIALLVSGSYLYSKSSENKVTYTSDIISTSDTLGTPEPTTPYALSDIAKHNSEDDCWVIVLGSVYDMTHFLDMHPGGKEAVIPSCGTDGSVQFNSTNEHTPVRRNLLKSYKIGVVVDSK
jgi:cytochrome b involved in lipid metabolism